MRPLSDSNNQEILQTVLTELNELRTRIDTITKWIRMASVSSLEISQANSGPDPLFDQALKLIQGSDFASASFLQRKLMIGYARAARILDELQEAGHIAEAIGSKPRKVLKKA